MSSKIVPVVRLWVLTSLLTLAGCSERSATPPLTQASIQTSQQPLTAISDATVLATPPQGMGFADYSNWDHPPARRGTIYVAKQCGSAPCSDHRDASDNIAPGACGDTPATACYSVHAGLWQLVHLQSRFPSKTGYDVLEILGDEQPYYVNHDLRWDAFGTGTAAHPRVIVGMSNSKGYLPKLIAGPRPGGGPSDPDPDRIPVWSWSGIGYGTGAWGLAFTNSSYWAVQNLIIDCQNQPRDPNKRFGIKVTYDPKTGTEPRPTHLQFKNVTITQCGQEAYELRGAQDIEILGGRLYNNQSEVENPSLGRWERLDSNGVTIQAGATRIRVKGVLSYLNSGDSVQCQGRLTSAEPYSNNPSHILIEDNIFHGNLENAVDIKSCHHVNITGSNYFFGYRPGDDNGGRCHGGAVIFHEEAKQILIEGARITDSGQGVAIGNQNFEVEDVIVRRNIITHMNQEGRLGNLDGIRKFNCGDGISVHRGNRVDIYHNTIHDVAHAGITVGVDTYFQGANNVRLWNNIISDAWGLNYFDQAQSQTVPTRSTDSRFQGGALHLRLSNSPGLYSQANLFHRSSGSVVLTKVDGNTGTQLSLAQWQTQMPTAVESQGNLDKAPSGTTPGSLVGDPAFQFDSVALGATSAALNGALPDTGNGGTNQRCNGAPDKGALESDCGANVCATSNASASPITDLSKLTWGRQLRTCAPEAFYSVAIGVGGDIIAAGSSRGSFGYTSAGGNDAIIKRYASSGSNGWTRQQGSTGDDHALGVATSAAGDVYVVGWTTGSLWGANQGGRDAFIVKYNSNGAQQWIRQLGTSGDDDFNAVVVNAQGEVYAVGSTTGNFSNANIQYAHTQALLVKYSAAGAPLYPPVQHGGTTEHGSDNWDYGFSDVALDSSGNVFATGWQTYDGQDGLGIYVRKFAPNGSSTVKAEYAYTQGAKGNAIAIDSNGQPWVTFTYSSGGSYCGDGTGVCARTLDDIAFLMRFSATTLEPQLYDNSEYYTGVYPALIGGYRIHDMAFDSANRLVMVGRANEGFLAGTNDAILKRVTVNLTTTDKNLAIAREWEQIGGTNEVEGCPQGDAFYGVAIDGNSIVTAGVTCGPMFSESSGSTKTHYGSSDALLMRFTP